MPEKRKSIQVIILVIFGAFAIIGLLMFATYSNKSKKTNIGRVVIWGTVDQSIMSKYLETLRTNDEKFKNVLYASYPKKDFLLKVTDALASGEGPDVIILNNEELLKYKSKLYPISYKTFDKRKYKDMFISAAEIFMSPDGIYALPFAIDPMVLYWNRDIFADNTYVEPPKLWREVPDMSRKITKRDKANNILLATIALGTYNNIHNAKGILETLLTQIGSGITKYNTETGRIYSGLTDVTQASKAFKFYTAFANPVSNVYSWNRSLPNSIDMFSEDRLAMYIGFVSDLPVILAKNPHLNFDVAMLPQVDKSDVDKKTKVYGKVWAFAITKASTNKSGAFQFVTSVLNPQYSKLLSDSLGIVNTQKAILKKRPDDPLKVIFRDSAIISDTFLDPDPNTTGDILSESIAVIISGQNLVQDAVLRAESKITALLQGK